MAQIYNTFKTYSGDGVTRDFAIPFTYEKQSEVVMVRRNGVASFTFISPQVVRIPSPLAVGDEITISRETDVSSPAVTWKNGSSTTGGQLNAMVRQLLNGMQEAVDYARRGLFRTPDGKYDFQSAQGKNLATPTESTDIANKGYVDGKVSGIGDTVQASAVAASNSASQANASAQSAGQSANSAYDVKNMAVDASTASQLARDKALLWANSNQNVQVEPGLYSAKHWAQTAQAIANGSASAVTSVAYKWLTTTNVAAQLVEIADAKGAANGLAPLNANGKLDIALLNLPITSTATKVSFTIRPDWAGYTPWDNNNLAKPLVYSAQTLTDDEAAQARTNLLDKRCDVIFDMVSNTQVRLRPYNGNSIWINGAQRALPSGIVLDTTNMGGGLTSYIYAYWTGSAVALEISATGYVLTAATYGMPVKSGDASRTLVGMVRPDANKRLDHPGGTAGSVVSVLSYWNRRPKVARNGRSASVTLSNTAFAEDAAFRVNTLAWSDELVHVTSMIQLDLGDSGTSGSNYITNAVGYNDGVSNGALGIAGMYGNIGLAASTLQVQTPTLTGDVYQSEGFHSFCYGTLTTGGSYQIFSSTVSAWTMG